MPKEIDEELKGRALCVWSSATSVEYVSTPRPLEALLAR
jgi:hypothetical protein